MRESQASHGNGAPVAAGKDIQGTVDLDGSKQALKKENRSIHPASRGVAAHTAGLFWSVTGAKGGVDHEDQISKE